MNLSISIIFTLITALFHFYFFVLETFFWTKPLGLRTFHMQQATANSSKTLAANQGVYNGMLALGLLLSLFLTDAIAIRIYCLCFIIVVGSYGAYSLKSFKVFFIQAAPAIIALVASL